MSRKQNKKESVASAEKQVGVALAADCVNFLSHAGTASVSWECIQTQSVFHQHADNIFSQTLSLWTLIRTVTFSCSSPHSLLTPYFTVVSCNMIVLRGILLLDRRLVSLGACSGSLCLFCHHLLGYSYDTVLTLWRRNYFFFSNFSTFCI